MKQEKEEIINLLKTHLEKMISSTDVQALKTVYFGKKGIVTELTASIASLPKEERKEAGRITNEIKQEVLKQLQEKEDFFKEKELRALLESEKIDTSLPATKIEIGGTNPLEKVIEELEELMISMGYDVLEGPEVELDTYNFELLNLPKGHPARDAQDTFYIKGDEVLLRSQTSPVQVRAMLANSEKTPVRMICPGKTYRRDDDDATHSHQFTQMEGLVVDHNISLAHLKGTFDIIAKTLFGKDRETRFRPSYYPFTEPSVELDISCFNCHGKGCHICKGTTWITVGGAGMVHPNVLKNCGYDPEVFTGFAFGFGVERLAMLKYGIQDVRTFYQTDLRLKDTFHRKEGE